MKIYFERSGGFTGRKLRATVDSADLPAGEADRLETMLARAHFFERSGARAPEERPSSS